MRTTEAQRHREEGSEPDEAGLLQQCPFCDYLLRGLPIEHRCPECGQPFDRHWAVFGEKKSSWLADWRWLIPVFTLILLLVVSAVNPKFVISAVLDCWPFFLLGGIIAWWGSRPYEWFVAVGATGILVGSRKTRKWIVYPWSEIVGIDCRSDCRLLIELTDRIVRVSTRRAFAPEAEAQRCVGYIRAMLDQRRGQTSDGGSSEVSD